MRANGGVRQSTSIVDDVAVSEQDGMRSCVDNPKEEDVERTSSGWGQKSRVKERYDADR
jgi:hypothetical protein